MRTYTFALSLVAHALMIGFAIVAPILATRDLPDPPRASTFVLVTAAAPDVPPPARRPAAPKPAAAVDAAPVVAPDGIEPEMVIEAPGDPFGDDLVVGNGAIPGNAIPGEVLVPPPPPTVVATPVRPGGEIRPPQKIHHVGPVYPALARASRIRGTVILEAVIAEDGSVQDVRVLRSVPLLDDAAADAVRQWRFTPTLLNGQPVRVLMTVTVAFGLN